jgi:hypothetical protein
MLQTSFYCFYKQAYAPVFMEIDVLLKTMNRPLTLAQAADALHVSTGCIQRLMKRENIDKLDQRGFMTLMRMGESAVCRLYQREIIKGCKTVYSPADIAYIYGLDEGHVAAVSTRLGKRQWEACQVPELLKQIPIYIFY